MKIAVLFIVVICLLLLMREGLVDTLISQTGWAHDQVITTAWSTWRLHLYDAANQLPTVSFDGELLDLKLMENFDCLKREAQNVNDSEHYKITLPDCYMTANLCGKML